MRNHEDDRCECGDKIGHISACDRNEEKFSQPVEDTVVNDKPRVRLTGENGNAFNVLALCTRAAKKAGWDVERINALKHEMASGDYDHLLMTAMRYFDVE